MNYQQHRLGLKLGTIIPKSKEKKPIPQKSAKKLKEEHAEKKERGEEMTEEQKWFDDKVQRLQGRCIWCGQTYDRYNPKEAIAAVAHVLPKRESMFPSVALHPENWMELSSTCSCHHKYDHLMTWEEIALSPIWPIVVEKFQIMEPCIKERHLIPEVLLQEIEPKL
jgi:hypothetical protein